MRTHSMKLKIKAKGYQNFTGLLGQIAFENAVSVDHVSKMDVSRLGSIIEMVEVNDMGEEIRSAGVGQDDIDHRHSRAEVTTPMKTVEEQTGLRDESNTTQPKKAEPVVEVEKKSAVETQPDTQTKTYNQAELEVIADEQGIVGLRVIGDALNVKGPSIVKLMDAILNAQKG